MLGLLLGFAVAHSGLAGLRMRGEAIIGARLYRVLFALVSVPLAVIFWAYDSLTRFILPQLDIFNDSQLGALRIMIIGLLLMVLMIWRPQGILGKKEELTLGK